MDCKLTSTRRQRRAGGTLVEALIAIGVTGLIMMALASISMVSGRSFVAFANYVDLDSANRIAMDILTRDIRECNRVTGYTTNRLIIEDFSGFSVTYEYDQDRQTLVRSRNGVSKTLLTGCESLNFNIAQRNPLNGNYDVYPTATVSDAKVVNVSWNCSRNILGHRANTENVQTARIVIRRQG
jgi:Tfp pilus assembly protein PilW